MTEAEAREIVRAAGIELLDSGLVDGTWGNISARVSPELMAITPSGRDYRGIAAEDIVLVDVVTGEIKGGGKPSTETPLHAAVYRERPEIGAVVHTHSMSASTVAAARREVPPILDDFAQIVGPSLRTADYSLPGSGRMARAVVKAMRGRMAALLANHGAVAVGRDMKGKTSLLIYAAATPLAFASPLVANALYVAVAALWLVPDRRIERVLPHS